jgi:hypothetical protein
MEEEEEEEEEEIHILTTRTSMTTVRNYVIFELITHL